MTIIDRIWAQIEDKVFISRDDFVRSLDGWKIEPVEIDGKLAFAAMAKGTEFHFTSFGSAPISRRMISEFVQPIIDEHGFVTTTTPKDDDRQGRFNRLIGFSVESEDEFFVHYRAERLRLGGNACPS